MTKVKNLLESYDIVVSDPPWYYPGHNGKTGLPASAHYNLMKTSEIANIVPPLSDNGILFLWVTTPKLADAFWLANEWNLQYFSTTFVWVKTRKDGEIMGAKGGIGATTKSITEVVLAFHRKGHRHLTPAVQNIRQVISEPPREHSRKPDAVMNRLDLMYPNATKLEMFSRQKRKGWHCVGDEVGKFND